MLKRKYKTLTLATAALAAIAATLYAADNYEPTQPASAPTVKLTFDKGKGSGVHIGGGLILTAAHVAAANDMTVTTQDGDETTAHLLWKAASTDLALYKSDVNVPAADIDCGTYEAGTSITSWGNPLSLDFVSSTGTIAGAPRDVGALKHVYVIDSAVISGQSGGPMFVNDKLAGIVIAVMTAPLENYDKKGWSRTAIGYGFAVPSSDICEMLGRTE